MIEKGFSHEVTVLISQFRRAVLYGKDDSETIKGAWKTYLSIKEKNLRPEPTSPIELEKIRKTIEIIDEGGLPEHNYITYAVSYGLRVDLGMFGTRCIIGDLGEKEKKKAASFAGKMSEVLLQKYTSLV